jgi:hypothetical protein
VGRISRGAAVGMGRRSVAGRQKKQPLAGPLSAEAARGLKSSRGAAVGRRSTVVGRCRQKHVAGPPGAVVPPVPKEEDKALNLAQG